MYRFIYIGIFIILIVLNILLIVYSFKTGFFLHFKGFDSFIVLGSMLFSITTLGVFIYKLYNMEEEE
jgi:hypothetical protein